MVVTMHINARRPCRSATFEMCLSVASVHIAWRSGGFARCMGFLNAMSFPLWGFGLFEALFAAFSSTRATAKAGV